jgi:hypothetical protein
MFHGPKMKSKLSGWRLPISRKSMSAKRTSGQRARARASIRRRQIDAEIICRKGREILRGAAGADAEIEHALAGKGLLVADEDHRFRRERRRVAVVLSHRRRHEDRRVAIRRVETLVFHLCAPCLSACRAIVPSRRRLVPFAFGRVIAD